jgi:hypothetical protein
VTRGDEALSVIRKFVDDNDIACEETVYQSDRVIENAYEFIAALCEIVGYKED